MKAVAKNLSAAACALVLPVFALAIWPVVELGVNDEWSYAKTVQILAQTGHIVYNGWATAIVGWQLYLAVAFVKFFGFSFTAVRLSILPVAMATVFLAHRIQVRCGINEWNATFGTLTLSLSPLFLPLSFNFMTDVPGLFVMVLCLYACLRALQASTDNAALAWICFAAVSNAIGGTVRQITWLGVLVMVPSTLWLLRRRPRFLIVGSLAFLVCIVFIYGAMHWFLAQPYSVPEQLVHDSSMLKTLVRATWTLLFIVPELGFLLLPILLFFIPAVPLRNRRAVVLLSAGSLLWAAFASLVAPISSLVLYREEDWLVPYFANYISIYGILQVDPAHGTMPIVLNFGARLVLTCLSVLGIVCFVAVIATRQASPPTGLHARDRIPWRDLGILLLPVTLGYLVLLVPRAAQDSIYDRYLLPLMFLAIIPVLRCYQEHVRLRIPAVAALTIALYATFAVAGTRDYFTRARASVVAIRELRAAGIPPQTIDGGWDYNGWNQIELSGYIGDSTIPVLAKDRLLPSAHNSFGVCRPLFLVRLPALSPRYGLAFHPADCLGPAGFAPVLYRTWLPPHEHAIYVVRIGKQESEQDKSRNKSASIKEIPER